MMTMLTCQHDADGRKQT